MTLQKREKILAISIIVLAAVALAYFLWPAQGESTSELQKKVDDLQKQVDAQKLQALKAKKISDRLAEFQRRALPPNVEVAQTLYQDWLRKLANTYFKKPQFSTLPSQPLRDVSAAGGARQAQRNVYVRFPFNIQCEGSLDKLTGFLYEFYAAGHLHKIANLIVTPVKDSSDLSLNITVEALSLPTATHLDKLCDEPSKRLKLASLDEYKKAIVERNMFAAFAPKRERPPRREEPKPPSKVDPLQFSYLTAIVEANGVPEAWLLERTTGQTFKVHEGEEFTIGKVRAKVNRIGYNEIEIEVDGQSHTIGYGSNLKM
jgi:Tfp pilus assembly protein PilO